jgi:hypothetical protein
MRSSTGWTAVNLNGQAGILVLDAGQQQKLTLHSTTIVSNFLSHWSTGQVQAFAAPALLGVMAAIDDFPECVEVGQTACSRMTT